jgi:integrase
MLGTFMKELRAQESVSARALEFLILTAVRTNEAINARWDEIDLDQRVWTIPAERMKAKREHRVPLTDAALRVMGKRPKDGGFLFVGATQRKPLSNMAMLTLLKRMGHDDLTVHGFRSTFRDWAAETTSFTREVAEAALAHTLSDKTEAAYRRGDLFEKRRKLMQAWANFCSSAADGKVVTLRRVASKR